MLKYPRTEHKTVYSFVKNNGCFSANQNRQKNPYRTIGKVQKLWFQRKTHYGQHFCGLDKIEH